MERGILAPKLLEVGRLSARSDLLVTLLQSTCGYGLNFDCSYGNHSAAQHCDRASHESFTEAEAAPSLPGKKGYAAGWGDWTIYPGTPLGTNVSTGEDLQLLPNESTHRHTPQRNTQHNTSLHITRQYPIRPNPTHPAAFRRVQVQHMYKEETGHPRYYRMRPSTARSPVQPHLTHSYPA